jgi:uncharacterized sodium:solute symporter family permease YidK
VDLYQKWKPNASQHQLVRTGRFATAVMVFIALLWIPVIQGADSLYGYLQAIQGYLAPPIFVVFFFGVFWKRLNAQGCLWAMVVGFTLGLFRMLVDTPVTLGLSGFEKGYTEGSFLWIVNNIYFQYFSVLITIVSAVVMVVVSYMTTAPEDEKIKNLTFATTSHEHRAASRESWNKWDVLASAIVLQVILVGYGYFGGIESQARTLTVALSPYFLLWIVSVLIAIAGLAVPKWRGISSQAFAGTIGSIVGFALALGLSYGLTLALPAVGFVIGMIAIPTGAVIGYAQGTGFVAQRQAPAVAGVTGK